MGPWCETHIHWQIDWIDVLSKHPKVFNSLIPIIIFCQVTKTKCLSKQLILRSSVQYSLFKKQKKKRRSLAQLRGPAMKRKKMKKKKLFAILNTVISAQEKKMVKMQRSAKRVWIQYRSIISGHRRWFFKEKNVQWSFQNSFLVSGTFPLISSASVQVSAQSVLSESYTECASMFHDPCPLIWATQRKMNNHTLVTRLTFSWHAALFRGQSIKSNHQL